MAAKIQKPNQERPDAFEVAVAQVGRPPPSGLWGEGGREGGASTGSDVLACGVCFLVTEFAPMAI